MKKVQVMDLVENYNNINYLKNVYIDFKMSKIKFCENLNIKNFILYCESMFKKNSIYFSDLSKMYCLLNRD